jgi:hypothetical protein
MSAKYSKSTGGIYPTNIYDTFPDDALPIPDALYEQYRKAEISGFDVVDGTVVEKIIQSPSLEQIRASTRCQSWQFRRALTQLGLRSDVEGAVAASDQDTQDMWEYATTIERLHPFVVSMAGALGKTDEEVDAVFALANSFAQ